ncbi:MAG: Hpt domain-containing protein [Bradyrhizobium sp.]
MNEFVEQFLLESRELVAQATDDLMALEGTPEDRERLDGAFRAFHTLKGAAGIVEFAAMGRTLHAAEDVLATLRSSGEPIASNVLDECLACLDLTSRWLDAMQVSGETPAAADADADDMIARLVGSMDVDEKNKSASLPENGDWLDRLRVAAGSSFAAAVTAVRFVPDSEAFFKGDDPFSIIASLPQLLTVNLALTDQALSLETMNPFSCSLEILALTREPIAAIQNALRAFAERTEVRQLAPPPDLAGDKYDLAQATSLIAAQIVLLREGGTEGLLGRIESAGRTVANALLYLGRDGSATDVEKAVTNAQALEKVEPLVAVIERVLEVGTRPTHPTTTTPLQVAAPRALRVDMDRIDALVKLTGELLVVKNAIGYVAKRLHDNEDPGTVASTLRDQHALFDRLATELQSAVLSVGFFRCVRSFAGFQGWFGK